MNAPATDYIIRPARAGDIDAFVELKDLAGPGFTSLAIPNEQLEARLGTSAADYRAAIETPNEERYFLALEHRASKQIAGMAQVKASIGVTKPFFNYRVLRIAQASAAAGRRFDLDVLALVNEFTGCAEVGSLFVRREHRLGLAPRRLVRAGHPRGGRHLRRVGRRRGPRGAALRPVGRAHPRLGGAEGDRPLLIRTGQTAARADRPGSGGVRPPRFTPTSRRPTPHAPRRESLPGSGPRASRDAAQRSTNGRRAGHDKPTPPAQAPTTTRPT